jgi:hypothetical protein
MRPVAENAAETGRRLEEAHRRAQLLTERFEQETANGTKAALAQQFAEALQQVEQAQAQLEALKTENEVLRRSRREWEGRSRNVGTILLDAGVITQDQFDEAVTRQKGNPGRSLAQVLIEEGFASAEQVAQGVASQQGVLYIQLDAQGVEPEAAALLPGRIAHKHCCIPLRADQNHLVLAMADPLNLIAIGDVQHATKRGVRPVVAPMPAIEAAIAHYYNGHGN